MTTNLMNMITCLTTNLGIGFISKSCEPVQNKWLSLFHLIICSLQKSFEDFYTLIYKLDSNFDIKALIESRNNSNSFFQINITLPNYSTYQKTTSYTLTQDFLINQELIWAFMYSTSLNQWNHQPKIAWCDYCMLMQAPYFSHKWIFK